MNDYRRMLEEGYVIFRDNIGEVSRMAWLGLGVFGFTTYDEEMDELFAVKAVEVCKAISNKTTFDYIKDPENYRWYLWLMNVPFFSRRTEWGTSIRGAWWDGKGAFVSEIGRLEFPTRESWASFVTEIINFAEAS